MTTKPETLRVRVPAGFLPMVDRAARKAGMRRPDYVRSVLLSDADALGVRNPDPLDGRPRAVIESETAAEADAAWRAVLPVEGLSMARDGLVVSVWGEDARTVAGAAQAARMAQDVAAGRADCAGAG